MRDLPSVHSGRLLIEGVDKSFSGSTGALPVLRGITLDVRAGEFLSIVGGSGCGKSTLLRSIAGLEGVDSGSLLLDGSPILGPGIDRGLVFQEHRLMPWLTVAENVAFGLKTQSDREREAEVSHYIGLVGLQGFERSYPHQLSGGMAQRAAIARALINRPGMLLMDEPFGALDAFTRIQLQEEVLRIWRTEGTTVLLVTHDIEEAVFLSDRVAIMSNRPGTLRKIVTVDLPRPRDRTTDAFTRLRALVHREFFAVRELAEDYHI
jgi:sulfonate transport system ATP-binding protein